MGVREIVIGIVILCRRIRGIKGRGKLVVNPLSLD